MVRRGVWFAGELTVDRMVELAVKAEQAGMDSVWVAEGYYGREAVVPLAAIARATSRVALAPGVVNPYTRHPALLAMTFATLDEVSNGRVMIGLGSGERHQMADQLGYDFSRPLTAVRESVDIIRQMLAGGDVEFQGKVFGVRSVRMAFRPPRPDPPLILAAVGPKMCQLAGEIADGVYFPQTSTEYVLQARQWVRTGAERAGRDPASIEIGAMIIMSASRNPEQAERAARPLLGLLLTVPEGELILEANGLDPAGAGKLRQALAEGGMRAMAGTVTHEMVARLAIVGDPDTCRQRLLDLVEAGVTHPVVSLIGAEPETTLEVIASLGAS